MKTIRKGSDIVVRWRIFRYGQEYDIALYRESISLVLSNMGEKKEITDYTIVDVNTIVFKYRAEDQGLGIYRLLLIDKSRNSTRIIEECNAFRLVNTSDAANNDGTLESAITITLTSELTAPADGLSAYEVALQNGFIGTEAEWLQSLVPDTTDIELAEAQRQTKELERIEAENARQSAELERQNASTEAVASANKAASNANEAAITAQQKAEEANAAASSANAVVAEFNSIIVQETGAAQDKVMSQKAVTDAMTASQAKLSELESDFNLLPVEKIILQDGKYLVVDGRELSNPAFGISDYISVAEGMIVSCANTVHNDVAAIGLYDDDKVMRGIISLSSSDDEVVFTIPAKIRFIRASYKVSSKDKFYIHTDFPSSTGYIGDKIDKLIELPISLNMDGYLDSTGTFVKNSGWKSSDFVDINFGYTIECTYYLTSTTYVCIYDKDKKKIASFPGASEVKKTTITINPNDYPTLRYLRVCTCESALMVDYSTKILSIFGILPNDYVTTPKIAEKAVTPAKSSFFIHGPNTDFIKQDNWVANKLINGQGQELSQPGFWATGFISLLPNTVYYNNALWYGYYAFYDSDKNLIEGHGNDGSLKNPFTTPAGTVYGRFTCINTDNKNKAWIGIVNNPAPYAEIIDPQYVPALQEKTYCDYGGNEFSMFNKCICVGDSLTEGVFNENGSGAEKYVGFKKYSYPTFLSKLTGVEVTNLGNAGDTSAEWYDRHKEDNLSGYDVAIIQLGTNDAARYSGWTETSITGFTNIINKLKNENTNIKIFVSTISKRFGDPSAAGKAVISDGIRQLVLSLADPNVILLDMEEYAHTGDEQAYECGHYSAYGYWRLAQDYKNIIGYYINSHKNLFRTVQFIGTDYSYSD